MKEIRSFLLSTLLLCFTLFSFTGCEDKKAKEPFIAVENTTEVITQKDKDPQEKTQEVVKDKGQLEKTQEVAAEQISLQNKEDQITKELSASQTPTDTFTLRNIQQNRHTLTINNQKINFHNIKQSIVVINFFSTWHSPCRGQIPYLSDLQKKYEKHVFIIGILINDEQSDDTLKQFISKYHANYYISNSKQNNVFSNKIVKELQLPENFPIPLTVIYKDGDYYTHYEGAVPVEMIDHDIRQVIKK